ncbi:MAG: exodeoxyribonuclease III [Alphaproteobacteria bacterium]|nr:exodeoxyribonuclease III [Alphaproteobacteria bacterium]
MRILTWNINSVRLRIGLLTKLLQEEKPDLVCLQETKCPDEHFPVENIRSAGYAHQHFHGMKSYNGVAILSRTPFEDSQIHHRVGKEDCRHISVRLPRFELHNLYVPAGGDEPDPDINDKFAHKLDFVDEMGKWFKDRYTSDMPLVSAGDFNIAPYEHDVWSHKQLQKVVSHTPIEIEKLEKMRKSLDWTDSSRHFIPEQEKCYTWWSYRNRDWRKSNRGRRLDHIWVTPPLKPALKKHKILTDARDWEKASDHVPLIIDLAA